MSRRQFRPRNRQHKTWMARCPPTDPAGKLWESLNTGRLVWDARQIRVYGSVTDVYLSGQLVCRNNDEVAIVVQHLDRHVSLTRAEPGCVSFSVTLLETSWAGRCP